MGYLDKYRTLKNRPYSPRTTVPAIWRIGLRPPSAAMRDARSHCQYECISHDRKSRFVWNLTIVFNLPIAYNLYRGLQLIQSEFQEIWRKFSVVHICSENFTSISMLNIWQTQHNDELAVLAIKLFLKWLMEYFCR